MVLCTNRPTRPGRMGRGGDPMKARPVKGLDADALEARARAGEAPDLDPTLASGTPHAEAWRGLETLCIYVEARRGLLFERFLELWRDLEREGFRARLRYAISERPEPPTPLSP